MCAKIKRKKINILQDSSPTAATGGSNDASSRKLPAARPDLKSYKDNNAMSSASSSSSSSLGSTVGPSGTKVDPFAGDEDEKEKASPLRSPHEARKDRAPSR
jgi:hypothetical protein